MTERIRLAVEVNLDPVPGWGNDAEDYRALTERLLDDSIPHYKPTVTIPIAHKRPGAAPLNFPTEVRPELRNMRGLGARIAESIRWSA